MKMRSYVIRDLLIWFSLLVVLPTVIFLAIYLLSMNGLLSSSAQIETASVSPPSHLGSSQQEYQHQPETAAHHQQSTSNNAQELMRRVVLSEALCNDGSPATYYIRRSRSSSMWVIVLEGGYFCYDDQSCRARAINSANLTSSRLGKRLRRGRGILASRADENPYWHDANLVTIPYCSSDLWIGSKKSSPSVHRRSFKKNSIRSPSAARDQELNFHFMGERILNDVLDDLISVYAMSEASLIVLAGQSAGGIGVLMNANRVRGRLARQAPQAQLKALVDSSWLLNLPYSFLCHSLPTDKCFMNRLFSDSLSYWNAQLPEECSNTNDETKWDCFLPYKILPLVKVPVFVAQSLFDETLLIEQYNAKPMSFIDQNMPPLNESMRFFATLTSVRTQMLETLSTVARQVHLFVSSCTTHSMLTRPEFNTIRLENLTLARALDCWALEGNHSLANDCSSVLTSSGDTNLTSSTMSSISSCEYPDCDHTCPALRHPDVSRSVADFIEYFSFYGLVNYRQVADLLGSNEIVVRQMGYEKFMKIIMQTNKHA